MRSKEVSYCMKKYKTNDLGFSLVELIIVVAIMSLFLGMTGYGLSLSSGKPAEECARKLAACIQHGRTTTMGKYRNIITISKESASGQIVVREKVTINIEDDGAGNLTEQTSERSSTVGSKGVKIEYSTDGGSSYTELAEGNSITLRFDSGSGALKKTALGDTAYYTTFKISKANKEKYVMIEALTGRVTVSDTVPAAP